MKSNLFSGRYLFHLHSSFTDGNLDVAEYFQFAKKSSVDRIIFLEHIRKVPNYAVDEFVCLVNSCAAKFEMPAAIGFEAKILPKGGLDICDAHIKLAEVIGIAEHGPYQETGCYQKHLCGLFEELKTLIPEKEVVWVHPGKWLGLNMLIETKTYDYIEILQYAQMNGVRIERNLKYGLIPARFISCILPQNLVIGADAHFIQDLENWERAMQKGRELT